MVATETATPELRRAARTTDEGSLSLLIEPWTADRPDPAHLVTTAGLESARRDLEVALCAGPDPIVVSGPTGHGKTLLLRSLRTRPPSGFVPIFVPFSSVEPDDLAGWILETGCRRLDRNPGAELARLLRANMQFGGRTLLLMDEVQATPCATISKLFEIITDSRAAVSVVLAGLPGEELDRVLAAIPHSIRRIAVSKPWNRADAELLLREVARTLRVDPSDLIAAVDVDAALSDSGGNPRLVRASLGARVRIAKLPRDRMPLVVAPAPPQPAAQLAASAPRDGAPPCSAIAIASPAAPASARSRRPPAPVRAERPRTAGLGSSTRRPALDARAWLESAGRRALAASRSSARSLRTHGHRMRGAARARASAASARLRSRSLACRAAASNGARASARRIEAIVAETAALAARIDRSREAIAASRKRAAQACSAGIIRLRRGSARQSLCARAWLDRAARHAHAALTPVARAIRMRGCEMAGAVRDRTSAVSARLRSRSLARGAAASDEARSQARQVGAAISSARVALARRVHDPLTGAAQRLRRGAWGPFLGAGSALAMAGAIAVLAAMVANGRTRAPAITELSRGADETIVETVALPIPFRVNSHPWSTIEIDGLEAGTTPFTISLEPGPHHFRAAMADGRTLEKVFVVSSLQDRLAFR